MHDATLTRLRSPPETPRVFELPMNVSRTSTSPSSRMMLSTRSTFCSIGIVAGSRSCAVNSRDSNTVGSEKRRCLWSRRWKGKVKQVDSGKVITEFTLPTGGMARKEMLAAHKDLRLAEARVETESWSDDELAMYRQCFEKVSGASDTKTVAPIVLFLSSSGLPQSTLKQVWAVANPRDKQKLGFEEFARCCRLVAHCQALAAGLGVRLVKEGGRPLRVKLRVECIFRRPPRLPTFDGRAPCLAGK